MFLDDVVRILHPEHAAPGHRITIRHKGSPVLPAQTWWSCSCGLSGGITSDMIREALDLAVSRT